MAEILCDTRSSRRTKPLVVMVTHGDADGLVSATIVKAFEEKRNPEQEFLIFAGMDVTADQTEKLFQFICKYNELGENDKVYILDRPIPPLTWLSMGYLCEVPIIHIDHHISNHPDNYSFHEQGRSIKHHWSEEQSAAYLSLDYFKDWAKEDEEYQALFDAFYPLARATSEWDIFHWKELGESEEDLLWKKRALSINAAEKVLGLRGFYQAIQWKDEKDYATKLFDYFFLLQDAYDCQLHSVYDFAKRSLEAYSFQQHKLAVIYGVDVNYQSMIADKLFVDKKYSFDVVAFVNMYGTVSFRGNGSIDLSLLAKKLGDLCGYSGGGHRNASGCKIYNRERIKENLLDTFYDTMERLQYMEF